MGTWKNYTLFDGLVNQWISAIHSDLDGLVWFQAGKKILFYDGSEFIDFTTRNGLRGDQVSVIYGDKDGVMWFGTRDRGVFRYHGTEFKNSIAKKQIQLMGGELALESELGSGSHSFECCV